MRDIFLELIVLLNSIVIVFGLWCKDRQDKRRASKVSKKIDAVSTEVKGVASEVRNGSSHSASASSNGTPN